MKILAFDTSLNKTYISLDIDGNTVSSVFESDEKNYHSAYLISGIKELTEKSNINLSDIDLIATNHGPGSFTGIRVGITVAKTMAHQLNKNVAGVSSLDILYEAYRKSPISASYDVDVILDARRETFYFRANDEIKLVPYSEISNYSSKNILICDSSAAAKLSSPDFSDFIQGKKIINFEEDNINLSEALINLAREKALNTKDLSWYTLRPQYIQTPPIHKH